MNGQPANEVNDVAPSSLSHLIGQRSVIDQVSVALDACQIDNRRFDHAMLVGSPGLGKSQLASVIAKEMATGFHEVLGQTISHASDLNALFLSAQDKDVIHIDEGHLTPISIQTALYLALDKRCIVLNSKNGKAPQTIPLADFTLLLSTTDEYGLLQPLRDRCRLVLRFEFYSNEELTTVLLQRTRFLGWEIHEELLPKIASRSRGTPRLALRLLQSCRRVARSQGETTITAHHLKRSCQLEQLHGDLGLGPTEQKYIQILGDGNARLNVISSMLGLPARTVSQVVEPFLLRTSLLSKDDQSKRQLTAKGREYLTSCRSIQD
ncbi:AAA family ATPase [Stieleria sp. JC731]|uniref:Holliday junction DNA helicase RuvB C-terminal domain-containing protein n=1 Tax=Pirellulaceae TaxID=2691357 RepID=UPI001E4EFC14|nr:Holliday junction DNA helicase RuvB C-terminal domain-containing protein [Stieleria sp. JC731]MCC9602869.1 AAA family ATPase [Stieleria sp. JC731]